MLKLILEKESVSYSKTSNITLNFATSCPFFLLCFCSKLSSPLSSSSAIDHAAFVAAHVSRMPQVRGRHRVILKQAGSKLKKSINFAKDCLQRSNRCGDGAQG